MFCYLKFLISCLLAYTCANEHKQWPRQLSAMGVNPTIFEDEGDSSEYERNPFQTRIANGRSVSIGDMPYMIQLRLLDTYRCGAAFIVADNGVHLVITAGQCITNRNTDEIYPPMQFTVVGGRLQRDGSHPYEQFRQVTQVYRWHTWKRTYSLFFNDMAILVIDRPFVIDRLVRPIDMPWRGSTQPEPNSHILVGGWGLVNSSFDSFADELQITSLEVLKWDACHSVLTYHITAELQNTHFCAGKVPSPIHRGACTGDRGSPAIAVYNNTPYLAGVFSYNHEGCGNRYVPNVFEDLSWYISWVRTVSVEAQGSRRLYSLDVGDNPYGPPGDETASKKRHAKEKTKQKREEH